MQSSRRAFLLGRRPVRTAWDELRARLSRVARGALQDTGPRRAHLTARDAADVRQARALCAEYGAVLALAGTPPALRAEHEADPPLLVVDPSGLNVLAQAGPGWRAGPGCLAGDLAQAGLTQFAGAPPDQTLALWLARQGAWPIGQTAASGVRELDVLLADGSAETLGPFGQDDLRPLRTATAQRLIPALFHLAGQADAATCLAAAQWPGRYRLDALRPRDPHGVNLAHLLLGHGGTLGWVEGAMLVPAVGMALSRAAASASESAGMGASAEGGAVAGEEASLRSSAARRLDIRIGQCFDPAGLYGGS
ncbi:Uncharacterised protein [Bordetella ansorpii]|uniref:Uncharacterized protein n=1 Tax=Bordetella ansorpii TaxID=288768 RepID=A0A157S709_9BORD|nr:hypothetical protein [Bordetella ansorpii]SAI65686.1 Uncharacterised protein [Bordetella ansorpii]